MQNSTLARALALALLAVPVAALAADERIAVLEFTGRGDPALLAQLADEVRGVAADELRGRYVVMTREAMALVLKQMGGTCKEGDCEVETARNVGAALVATGELRRIGGALVLGLKLHETEKGALLGAETVRATDPLKLLDGCREAAKALLGRALAVAPAAAPATTSAQGPAAPPPLAAAPDRRDPAEPPEQLKLMKAELNQLFSYRMNGEAWTADQRVDFAGCKVQVKIRAGSCTQELDFALPDIGNVAVHDWSKKGKYLDLDYGSIRFLRLSTAMMEKRVRYGELCTGPSPSQKTEARDGAFVYARSPADAERVAKLFEQLIASCKQAQ